MYQLKKYRYNHVACGGTFDLFHKGHQTFLLTAFGVGRLVSIGITTDAMNKRLGKTAYQNQAQRFGNVKAFLKKRNLQKRTKLIPLSDLYGVTLSDKSIEAIVVSKYTIEGAYQINSQRTKGDLPRLPIIICPKALADDGKSLSSSRIRNGQISRGGRSFKRLLLKIAGRQLTKQLRNKLKIPLGPIVKSPNKRFGEYLITVGDVTTHEFLKREIIPKLSIVDFLVERKPTYNSLTDLGFDFEDPDFQVSNTAGAISRKLISTVEKAIKVPSNQVILVKGEEDLATVAAVLLAPLETVIFYGQPEEGIVKVDVDEKIKERLARLISS